MKRTLVPLLLALVAGMTATEKKASSTPCEKSAKAETYLDTAADMISRVKENLPKDGGACKCPRKPMDCEELLTCGHTQSRVYKVWPKNRIIEGGISVYCDMDTDGGGWTVIQRRGDYKRASDFFNKKWKDYKAGFGDKERDFWLGNDNIYALTNQRKYYLRIDLQDSENNTRYAFYDQFWIDSESQTYKLHVYDYFGDAGDSFAPVHGGQMFSTADRDNDKSSSLHCALRYKSGWWFNECFETNLNGLYYMDGNSISGEGIMWNSWKSGESLTFTEMKLRPVDYKGDLAIDVEPK